MTLVERTELPQGVNGSAEHALGGVRDDRADSPLALLHYRAASQKELDGDALVELPSGRFVRVRNYSEAIGHGAYGIYLYTDTGPVSGLLEEFLREAGIDSTNFIPGHK